jgi:hypothetical protein
LWSIAAALSNDKAVTINRFFLQFREKGYEYEPFTLA